MNTTSDCIRKLRYRIFESPISQERVAEELGIDPAPFSRILRGLRPAPEGFAERIEAALDRLEAAERAAEAARARVMAEGAVLDGKQSGRPDASSAT